ncbi:MAG: hypothetical protein U0234_12720 [Sandaracinus sp.]
MPREKELPVLEELTLAIDGAATPERVATVARMFADALRAAGDDDGMVTMVVQNFDMRASVRGRDEQGAAHVSDLIAVVDNPMRAVQDRPALREVAAVFAKYSPDVAGVGGRFHRRRRVISKLDGNFVAAVQAAAKQSNAAVVLFQGVTDIYSPVLRVGRQEPGSLPRARVVLGGRSIDIALEAEGEELERFFDAAKHPTRLARIKLHATWHRGEAGEPVMDVGSARLMRLSPWTPMSGPQMLTALGRGVSDASLDALWSQFEDDES